MPNTKHSIQRGDLKSNDLKRVIVRIDFTGVIDIDEYVKGLIRRVFKTSNVEHYVRGAISKNKDSIKNTAKLLGVEEREIYNASIHRFSYIKQFLPNEVDVDITENSIAVDIKCEDYKGFDSYKTLIGILWSELWKHSPFLDVKRIGIRKICAFLALNGMEFREKVEEKVFPDPIVNEKSPHCIHIDNFFWEEQLINCSLSRELQTGWTEIDNKRKEAFQFTLDYDLYVDENLIKNGGRWKWNKNCQDIENILEELNNLHFYFYKESITTQYLVSLCHDR